MARRKDVDPTIPCKIERGVFSFERGIWVELDGGRRVAVPFVDRSNLLLETEPVGDESVDGRTRIRLVDVNKDTVLFDLPAESIQGQRFQVSRAWANDNIQNKEFPSEIGEPALQRQSLRDIIRSIKPLEHLRNLSSKIPFPLP